MMGCGGDLLGKVVHGRGADVDGAGRHRVDDLIVGEELPVVEYLESDGVLGLFLQLLLEAHHGFSVERIGHRRLQGRPERNLLSTGIPRRKQERHNQQVEQAFHRAPRNGCVPSPICLQPRCHPSMR